MNAPILTYRTRMIPMVDYIRDYRDAERVRGYCMDCQCYSKTWVCPPFQYNIEQELSSYPYIYLISTRIQVPDHLRHLPSTPKEQYDLSYDILYRARGIVDPILLDLERTYSGSSALFAGSCRLCTPCTRIHGKPCRYPDRARPSLEAYGFDVARTADELLSTPLMWSRDLVLPEYFTYVSALLCQEAHVASPFDHSPLD